LFGDGFGERVKACARSACKDDAFPLCRALGASVFLLLDAFLKWDRKRVELNEFWTEKSRELFCIDDAFTFAM